MNGPVPPEAVIVTAPSDVVHVDGSVTFADEVKTDADDCGTTTVSVAVLP